ncbi:hypothetical protein Clacol_000079 [Clathrus columnatus]|uniref:AB hydrolase-1 domain-containing protein n=1 Tax=Clathrus columnatus TaxID=1419009 RepID=A0AAV4ZY01_9AGAM|nr:hypothetical protein Clacol_000079 [Clathrus columnatus]
MWTVLLSLLHLLSTVKASACSCNSGFVPVSVDVTIPKDPSNPGGLNTTDTIQLRKTFDIFGELCQPVEASEFENDIQILLHGQTYAHGYWDTTWNGYQNYSYVSFSCQNGITSFAYDEICAGLSSKPLSEECQLPSAAAVASSIARDAKSGTLAQILTGRAKEFQTVIGIGHSIGSVVFNYEVIKNGASSPYDGLILTGHIHDLGFLEHPQPVSSIANQADPARFGNLDPGYITLDILTFDAGATWLTTQAPFVYVPAVGYHGPVVEMVGEFDQLHCISDGGPCVQSVIQKSEPGFFPQSPNVTTVGKFSLREDLKAEPTLADCHTGDGSFSECGIHRFIVISNYEQFVQRFRIQDDIQILLHGETYTHAYWDTTWNGYQNYSYVSFSCQNGITSFAYDNICSGLSSKPLSEECQLPSAAAVASSIASDAKNGTLAQVLTGQTKQFQTVIGIGHSLGSGIFNYEVIKDGASSPYDGLILTVGSARTIASQADPARFGDLDPGYTTVNGSARSLFYGPTDDSFSPVIFQLDVLTFDANSKWLTNQIPFVYVPAVGYGGPVVVMVGEFDQVHCSPDGGPCVQSVIQGSEPAFFPQSLNVTTIVIPGTGHSLNAEFTASSSFLMMNDLFRNFVNRAVN